ncbi:MAG: carbohydrate ABC transporter substrate-binding protein [Clostridia bacterium]|nr:carbohydrate ABC transporter substrate-binding protein [Clostridia bacterium]
MKHRTLPLLLALLLLTASCGEAAVTPSDTDGTTKADTDTAADTTAPGYDYPSADYGGHEFVFLNVTETSWANDLLAPEETTGDLINDILFARNGRIEERYNITIREDKQAMNDIPNILRQTVTAGDDTYDACMLPIHKASGIISENYVLDLSTVEALNLDEPWWDQAVIDACTINGHTYMATSDINFFPFEATWAIFFNESMMDDLKLDYPYQLVRDGEWTIDKLYEYAKAGAALNSDSGYTPFNITDGTARYGFCSHHDFPLALIVGSGGRFASLENDTAVFSADSEKMFNLYEKITWLTSAEGTYYNWDSTIGAGSTIAAQFMNGRFMMASETLGYLEKLRDMDDFGVLPIPKYDDTQENYYSIIASYGTTMTTIPASCGDARRSGVILDAMAYDSYVNLMEPYYELYLTQKGVRNEDSAEMLSIIRESRTIATDVALGWTSSLHEKLKAKLKLGESDVASLIEGQKSASLAKIEETLTKMN